MLLEDAGDRSLLHELDERGDGAATAIAAEVLHAMHAPLAAPAPATLPTLEVWFSSLLAQDGESSSPVAEYVALARRLLAEQRDVRPLHGDLHHENVHRAERGWVALDPKGLLGDPAFDAGNMFRNPLGREELTLSSQRIRTLASALGTAIGRTQADILRWAIAHVALSAAWYVEDGADDKLQRDLRVIRALRGVLEASG